MTGAQSADERAFDAPVDGGLLHGTVWHPDTSGTPVLAVHGMTANQRCWPPVARLLPDRPVIGVDLRGRGRSNVLPGPYALVQHADDLARALEALRMERVIVTGHSMGAFVAVRLAERHPDRVRSLVLVDGGLPLPGAGANSTPADLEEALGPALRRLRMRFASPTAYLDFWREHPAFGPYWSAAAEEYLAYDLVDTADGFRASAKEPAVLANLIELDGSGGYAEALRALTLPITLLRAERGMFDQTPPLCPAATAEEWASQLPRMRQRLVPDTNHYTILLDSSAAGEVAATISEQDDSRG